MRGEISVINRIVEKLDDNPIKEDIGKFAPLHIISVINDEYWKEHRRKLETSPYSTIIAKGLGSWTVKYSPLKGYIRTLIREIRKQRKYLVKLQEIKPKTIKEETSTWMQLKSNEAKLQAAWQQLEEQRKIYILRYLLYTYKKKTANPEVKLNYDYTWFPYSFRNQLLNNNNFDHNLVQPIDNQLYL